MTGVFIHFFVAIAPSIFASPRLRPDGGVFNCEVVKQVAVGLCGKALYNMQVFTAAAGLTAVSSALQDRFDLPMADEGYLWEGARRTAAASVTTRRAANGSIALPILRPIVTWSPSA